MKFAHAGSANGRGQMRERQRRARATTPTLRSSYPQFASLRIDFEFSDRGRFTPAPISNVMHPPANAFFHFPCPYADCDGEFDLTASVAELANDPNCHRAGQLNCTGHRIGDAGHIDCKLTLDYRIEAQRG
jgi:hypothetical protein